MKTQNKITIDEEITTLLNTFDGEDIDLCYNVSKILRNTDANSASVGLRVFFDRVGVRKPRHRKGIDTMSSMSTEEFMQYSKVYSEYANGLVKMLVSKAHSDLLSADEFYKVLWETLMNNQLIDNTGVYAVILLRFAQNPVLPYYELKEPIKMSQEDFAEIVEEHTFLLRKVIHILNMEYPLRTDTASLILNEILDIKDYKKQTVFLAMILSEAEKKLFRSFPDLLNQNNQMKAFDDSENNV